jgi:Na+-driven multidrug efflux pump
VINCLLGLNNDCKLELKKLKVVPNKLLQILRIGVPSGLSTSLFSISNVLIQSSINSMGPAAITGNTIAANIGQFVMCINNGFYQASLSFTSQNYGAKDYKRICDVLKRIVLGVVVSSSVVGFLSYIFGRQLLGLYSSDPDVIACAMVRLMVMNTTFFIAGVMDGVGGALRGMKLTMIPMMISMFFVCFMRVGWLYTVFAWNPTGLVLYLSYPVTWLLAATANIIYFTVIRKKLFIRK